MGGEPLGPGKTQSSCRVFHNFPAFSHPRRTGCEFSPLLTRIWAIGLCSRTSGPSDCLPDIRTQPRTASVPVHCRPQTPCKSHTHARTAPMLVCTDHLMSFLHSHAQNPHCFCAGAPLPSEPEHISHEGQRCPRPSPPHWTIETFLAGLTRISAPCYSRHNSRRVRTCADSH